MPDLIANSMQLPIRQYAAKGLLEDLWPYIDADPEYSRDKLMTKPLESLQTDGKLYQLPIDFGVTTAIGLGKVVDGYDTWTLADVNDALSKLPEGATVFNKDYTQAEMLQYCVAMNADSFMNWQDGTCSFDSDEFRALLEFVKPFPTDYDWQSDSEDYESDYTSLKNGKQLLYPTSLSGFSDLYYTFAALNNDIRFVGFPREDGSSGNAFNASCTLSISTTCKDKSGAWAFIRSTLSDDYQKILQQTRDIRTFSLTPEQYREFSRQAKDKVLFAGIQDKEQPDAPIDLVIPTTDLELANVIFERLFGSLEKPQEERSSKKESRSERSSDDTGSSSPTSRKNSKNDRPSVGEQLQSFREKLSGVEPRVPAREKMHSEITK